MQDNNCQILVCILYLEILVGKLWNLHVVWGANILLVLDECDLIFKVTNSCLNLHL